MDIQYLTAQFASSSNIYSFDFDITYEVVNGANTWQDAAACAVARCGKLAEINDGDNLGTFTQF